MRCRRVLIVEDDEAIRETLRLSLELEGYQVSTASNGQEAIDTLSGEEAPCVILLDLMMPVMNGWEFIEYTQKDPRLSRIPVLIVTAYYEQAKKLKADGVIKKPIDLDVLMKTLDRYFEPVSRMA